jgi:hypothetical protein
VVTTVRVAPTRGGSRPRRRRRRRRHAERVGLVGWTTVVAVAVVWGTLSVADAGVGIRAAPLMGRWDEHPGWGLAPAAALGAAAACQGPALAARLPWRRLLAATALTTLVWTVALAASDGRDRLTEPLTSRHEYAPAAAQVDDIGAYVRAYVDHLGDQPVHVQGHPPGPVVLAWLLDRIGLAGAGWLAAVALAGWALAAACTLVAARGVSGEAAARRAAPALAVLPAALWAGTSLDALFAGVIALAVCLVLLVGVSRHRRSDPAVSAGDERRNGSAGQPRARSDTLLGVAGGVSGGCALMLTYGALPLLLAGTAVALTLAPRPFELAAAAGIGALAVLGAAAAAGFWWPDGLAATHGAYWSGLGGRRPGVYLTLVGNPASLALATGPAVAAGLASLASNRRRPSAHGPHPALLPAAALAAVAAADLSQLARGEVERIWLPFVPWLALAAPGDRRGWLAAQVAVALLLQSILVSPW